MTQSSRLAVGSVAPQKAGGHAHCQPPSLLQGIRTFVVTNATGTALAPLQHEGRSHNEIWASYPDVPTGITKKRGDVRAALAPALASTHLVDGGQDTIVPAPFSWLLYGDDDVAFFWPGVLRVLQHLDPEQPFFLTGEGPCAPCFWAYRS
ncbi:hypothetical protein ABPG75_009098 [Micractinium tetrahymenae]